MAECFENTLQYQRNEQQETDSANHRKRQKTGAQESPNALTGFCLNAPDRIQSVLELPEYAAGAEQGERDPNDGGQSSFARMRRLLCNVLHDLNRAWIEEITHLLGNLIPDAGRIVAKKQTKNG